MELPFKLYVNGIYFSIVWLTHAETSDLEPIGRAVSGLKRYRSKTMQNAVYVEVLA